MADKKPQGKLNLNHLNDFSVQGRCILRPTSLPANQEISPASLRACQPACRSACQPACQAACQERGSQPAAWLVKEPNWEPAKVGGGPNRKPGGQQAWRPVGWQAHTKADQIDVRLHIPRPLQRPASDKLAVVRERTSPGERVKLFPYAHRRGRRPFP
jgi:hypothetical protein